MLSNLLPSPLGRGRGWGCRKPSDMGWSWLGPRLELLPQIPCPPAFGGGRVGAGWGPDESVDKAIRFFFDTRNE